MLIAVFLTGFALGIVAGAAGVFLYAGSIMKDDLDRADKIERDSSR